MKTTERIAVAITTVGILTFVSCAKENRNGYSDSTWSGEYPIQTQNGSTGEMEDHTGTILLEFTHSGNECFVETGIEGLFAVNHISLEARWPNSESFSLYRNANGQSLLEYSGKISGEMMELQALNCDSVAATYNLTRTKLKE